MPKKLKYGQVSTWEALRAMGLVAPTSLELAWNPGAALKAPPGTVADACRKLKCSRYKLLQALERDPNAPPPRKGRPPKGPQLTLEMKRWATCDRVLGNQVDMPIDARRLEFNRVWSKNLTLYQFKRLYLEY